MITNNIVSYFIMNIKKIEHSLMNALLYIKILNKCINEL